MIITIDAVFDAQLHEPRPGWPDMGQGLLHKCYKQVMGPVSSVEFVPAA